MSGLVVLLIVLGALILLGLVVMGAYNRLVRLRQFANQAFAAWRGRPRAMRAPGTL